jgi:hypothetical protein
MTNSQDNKLKQCFVLCPIGDDQSPDRLRSDKLLKFVFSPVLASNGYKALRADHVPKSGMITSQIINLIIESPLVLADLTGGNPNVFYELAIRHATGKPYIQIIEKGEPMPFDIRGVRTIEIDSKDLDSVEDAKNRIDQQIKHFHDGHQADSPISVAASVRLIQSDSSYADKLLEKLDEIQGSSWYSIDDLGSKLDNIESKLDDIEKKIDYLDN